MINRILYRGTIILSVACSVILILISPLGLEKLATIRGVNWVKLSNIGQTYGAVSALIAGVALVGVVISLIIQNHSLTVSRIQMARTFQFDLIKFSIENPWLLPGWGFTPKPGSTIEDIQMIGFVNVIVGYWASAFQAGSIGVDELRGNISGLFKGEAGRKWWTTSDGWATGVNDRRLRHAAKIMQEEYEKAESIGPPLIGVKLVTQSRPHGVNVLKTWRSGYATGIILAFGAGFAAANRVRRNRRFISHH